MPAATLDGRRVHWLDQGEGQPALVLLHAFPLHAGMWAPQIEALSTHTRVVAPDLLGFGASAVPDDPDSYSVDGWADQVAGLIEHLGLGPVVLGGLSMGGYVAFAFVRRHRSRLAGLVLADTRPGPDTPEVAERRRNHARQVLDGDLASLRETLLEGLLSEHTRHHRPEVVDATRALTDQPPAGVVGALSAMLRRSDSTPDLAIIDVPTLVVVGEEDGPSPPAVARAMQGAVPGATLAVLAGAGHLSSLEAPEAFNTALEQHLGRCRAEGERR